MDKIHTVAPWNEAIDALKHPPAKLVIARDKEVRADNPNAE